MGHSGRITLLAAGRRGRARGPCRPAPWRQVPTAVPRGVSSFYIFFSFPFLTHFYLFKNNKLISVSIITREYHNQRVDANSLYKIMVKVVLHLNATVPLRPNSSSAIPGLVPIVLPGVRCPDHPRSKLVGDGVAEDRNVRGPVDGRSWL
jgi:hypothetical protein